MICTTIAEGNFHIFRLVQGGDTYWLQQFSDHGLHQMEMSEAELRTILAALPPRFLYDALNEVPIRRTSCDNNPFFHLGEQ